MSFLEPIVLIDPPQSRNISVFVGGDGKVALSARALNVTSHIQLVLTFTGLA